ncbi:MAG: heme peroxidase family protein [Geminicoccaceae bacterium]
MLTHASHEGGVAFKTEIQFATRFDYMFPELARDDDAKLPAEIVTLEALQDLGKAIVQPSDTPKDSAIPAVFTYLGQFIDHDLTARTDRELFESRIAELDGTPRVAKPVDPDAVVSHLTNGRRPHFDLDSVYGDGPGMIEGVETEAQKLYTPSNLRMAITDLGTGIDLPRANRRAIIADMRNDENVQISQLHARFLAFHNVVADAQGGASAAEAYVRARQLSRLAYQAVVLNDYLPTVCHPAVVADIIANGPRHFAPAVDGSALFMPLEFSVAAFRFGHSMIRPSYRLNGVTPAAGIPINELLEAAHRIPDGANELPLGDLVDWSFFVRGGSNEQRAQCIDAKIAKGLGNLPFGPNVLQNLAMRNLLRGYMLSLPTGQAVARAMGIQPMTADQLVENEDDAVVEAFEAGCFHARTPLWYYVLKEADVQCAGQCLGAVGSRLVAETIVGMIKQDPNGLWHCDEDVVTRTLTGGFAVKVTASDTVTDLNSFLSVAGASL